MTTFFFFFTNARRPHNSRCALWVSGQCVCVGIPADSNHIRHTSSGLWKSCHAWRLMGYVCVVVMEMSWRSLCLSWRIRTITLTLRASVASAAAVTRSWTLLMTPTPLSTKLASWPAKSTRTWTGRKVRFNLKLSCHTTPARFEDEMYVWPWSTKPVIRVHFSKLRFMHHLRAE